MEGRTYENEIGMTAKLPKPQYEHEDLRVTSSQHIVSTTSRWVEEKRKRTS